ncbi:MAG: DUF2183 domain-containing protein [Planctomycetales bacterium]|nr:DUF2183 domain-containing protein [Planctomycetales bacterium]
MIIRVLRKILKVSVDELDSDVFRDRIQGFLVVTERGKRVAVEFGEFQALMERKSRRNGHFRGSLRIPIDSLPCINANPWLDFRVLPGAGQQQTFPGRVQLLEDQGISVISDIDDTIKLSDVADRRQLLRNTFLNDFRCVSGMPLLYQEWAAQGAAFHYVSSSPWQLFDSIHRLLSTSNFPEGSYHLRTIRLRDPSFLRLFVARRSSKRRVIKSIFRLFPGRKFVLVGDSGEHDPEIYGSLGRLFPHQLHQILIRRVPGRPVTRERVMKAFRDLPTQKWQFFTEPHEIDLELPSHQIQ